MGMYSQASDKQTEKQRQSKSPLYGYRKPLPEEKDGVLWCQCTIPVLTHGTHRGMAWCMRCSTPYYH